MPTNPHRDDCDEADFDVDEASDESFPASDPPSYTGSIASAEEVEDDGEEEEA